MILLAASDSAVVSDSLSSLSSVSEERPDMLVNTIPDSVRGVCVVLCCVVLYQFSFIFTFLSLLSSVIAGVMKHQTDPGIRENAAKVRVCVSLSLSLISLNSFNLI